ncbi:hypothetical protein Anapl_18472 [Anas platyrhynchos]|uniref:Uncharacterized protein n=1 Tax=Anas platyrhynchos TaxID=8839 RepID=R0LM16_ANAPL|nr:hypothetical protein Anapl_18472 [Anas platyrhynchos]
MAADSPAPFEQRHLCRSCLMRDSLWQQIFGYCRCYHSTRKQRERNKVCLSENRVFKEWKIYLQDKNAWLLENKSVKSVLQFENIDPKGVRIAMRKNYLVSITDVFSFSLTLDSGLIIEQFPRFYLHFQELLKALKSSLNESTYTKNSSVPVHSGLIRVKKSHIPVHQLIPLQVKDQYSSKNIKLFCNFIEPEKTALSNDNCCLVLEENDDECISLEGALNSAGEMASWLDLKPSKFSFNAKFPELPTLPRKGGEGVEGGGYERVGEVERMGG